MATRTDATHPNAEAFPRLSGPALRALARAGIRSMHELSKWTESDVRHLNGMGPKGIRILTAALKVQGRRFRAEPFDVSP